jgi:probable HAF family extracellular repeat protein
MKTKRICPRISRRRCSTLFSMIVGAGLLVWFASGHRVLAQGGPGLYTFLDLGTFGGHASKALDINKSGVVVGWANMPSPVGIPGEFSFAFRYRAGLENLGTLGAMDLYVSPGDSSGYSNLSDARAINDAGEVVGQAQSKRSGLENGLNAYRYNTSMQDISGGNPWSFAEDIDSTGTVIVGSALFQGTTTNPVVWRNGGAMQNLYQLGCGFRADKSGVGQALGVNDVGVIVGHALLEGPYPNVLSHAFRCTPTGGTYRAEDLGPPGADYSIAYRINNSGQSVGQSAVSGGPRQAVLWGADGVVHELGFVPPLRVQPIDASSVAYDINQLGDVVGSYHVVGAVDHAFLWRGGVMYDLNDFLPPNSGWVLNEAKGINDAGQIAGTATRTIDGEKHAFRLTPFANVDIQAGYIEVVQSIQDADNTVPLIATKRTFALVHAKTAANVANAVTAYLYGERNGVSIGAPLQPQNNTSKRINIVASPQRTSTTDTFIFELPSNWIAEGSLSLRAEINPDRSVPETEWANNTATALVTFTKPDFLNVRLLNIGYNIGGFTARASQRDKDLLVSQLRRMYPAKPVVTAADMDLPFNPSSIPHPLACMSVNFLLAEAKSVVRRANSDIDREVWYAMVTDLGGFMRGCYSSGDGGVASGPTGDPSLVGWLWDVDGSYGDWMGTHEIAHALGESHAGFCQDWTQRLTSTYPYPNGIIGGPASRLDRFAGFDAGDSRAGYNILQRPVQPDWTDNMTYCDYQWISDYTDNRLRSDVRELNLNGFTGDVAISDILSGEAVTNGPVSITGSIDLLNETAQLSFVSRLPQGTPVSGASQGPYHIRLLDATDKVIADYPFTPGTVTDAEDLGAPQRPIASLTRIVPYAPGVRRIVIYSDLSGMSIGSMAVSPGKPVITGVSLPAGTALPSTGSTRLTWTGTDPDNDSLRYMLVYSNDNRATWRPLAAMVSASNYTLDNSSLAGGAACYMRIIANDGLNTGYADAGPFLVPNKPPSASIISPAANAIYATGQAVPLQAEGTDLEDGRLPDSAFAWSSSRDGQLGTGALFHARSLSVGQHILTLSVTDTQGLVTRQTVNVTIIGDVAMPNGALAVGSDRIAINFDQSTGSVTRVIPIRNTGSSGALLWQASSDNPRVTLAASYGVTPANLVVQVNTMGLSTEARLTAHVSLSSPGLSAVVVTISAASVDRALTIDKTEIDFGTQSIGVAGPTQQITVSYRGSGAFQAGSATLAGASPADFAVSSNTCTGTTLTSGGSCRIGLLFKPSKASARSAYLVLSGPTSTGGSSAYLSSVKLGGTGAAAKAKSVAWGSNSYGQIGVTGTTQRCSSAGSSQLCEPIAREVTTLQDVKKVAVGDEHSVAIKQDGSLWTWGRNTSGQLGTGSTDDTSHPVPARVPGLQKAKDTAASSAHSIAALEDGTVWTWGSNIYGELGGAGDISYTPTSVPVQVKAPNGAGYLTGVTAVAAADGSTGRFSMALRSDGTVWTWGYNVFGILATGSTEDYLTTPRPVVGPDGTGTLTGIVAIAPNLALRSDGTVWAWGAGSQGELGTGTAPQRSTVPVQVQNPSGGPLRNIVAIAGTIFERFALTNEGKVWAWGNLTRSGGGQQLGVSYSYTTGTSIPRLVVSPNDTDPNGLSNVAILQPHLVIKTDGTVWSWGNDLFGELGIGAGSGSVREPVQVRGIDGNGVLTGVTAIAAGNRHRIAVIGSSGVPTPPTGVVDQSTITVMEGTTATASGSFTDPQNLPLTFSASRGSISNSGNGQWTWTEPAYDGPVSDTVTITATASDGRSARVSFLLVIVNVPPAISPLVIDPIPTACQDGATARLSFNVTDPAGLFDPINGYIDWGDGTKFQYTGTGNTYSHHYSPGSYVITVDANDGDGGSTKRTTSAGQVAVVYASSGILQPLNADNSSVFNVGATIPVKTRFTDCTGQTVATLRPAITLSFIDGSASDPVNEVESSSSADSGTVMRWDGNQYIYNLSTKRSEFNNNQDLVPGRYRLTINEPRIAPLTVIFRLR